MLDYAVRVERVGDLAVEFKGYAGGDAVGGHEGDVFFHLFGGVGVLGAHVPMTNINCLVEI